MRGDWCGDWERGAREAREMRGEISSRDESENSRGESEGAEAARREREPHEPPSSSCRLSTCRARGRGEALGSAPSSASSSASSSARRRAAASLSTPTQPSSSRLPGDTGDTFIWPATTAIAISATVLCGCGGLMHRGGDEVAAPYHTSPLGVAYTQRPSAGDMLWLWRRCMICAATDWPAGSFRLFGGSRPPLPRLGPFQLGLRHGGLGALGRGGEPSLAADAALSAGVILALGGW